MAFSSNTIGKLTAGDAFKCGFSECSRRASPAGYITAVTDVRLAKEELAPWTPLIWRSQKNASSCGQHVSCRNTESFEWSWACWRSIFLRHFQIQCIVDAKSLYDHLISLSPPSSVEDKRCGFDLVISRQCMQRLGATIRWTPTNRQLADALMKDSTEPVDLLRSTFLSERQQNDPDVSDDKHLLNLHHYRVSQWSHQMLSWFNHESVSNALSQLTRFVSWSSFHPWAMNCRCAVFFFLESLDSEHSSSATSVKVKVPAMVIDGISFEERAATLTLTWSKNTRKVQVQGFLTMLDRAKEQLIKLFQTYRTYCESGKVLPPPKGGERAAAMLRCRAKSDYLVSLENGSESNRRRATFVPEDPAFGAIVEQITTGGTCLWSVARVAV